MWRCILRFQLIVHRLFGVDLLGPPVFATQNESLLGSQRYNDQTKLGHIVIVHTSITKIRCGGQRISRIVLPLIQQILHAKQQTKWNVIDAVAETPLIFSHWQGTNYMKSDSIRIQFFNAKEWKKNVAFFGVIRGKR